MAPEETKPAVGMVNVAHRAESAKPAAGVFGEGGGGGLEEDFDAVKGGDAGFGLGTKSS